MAIKIDGVNIVRVFDKVGTSSAVEVFKVIDNGVIVHRRPLIEFAWNYTSGNAYTQRRTYGLEQITNPGSPSRSGSYYFKGWYTTPTGNVKVSFPVTVPNIDSVVYYAQWGESPTAKQVTASSFYDETIPGEMDRYLYIFNPNDFAVRVNVRRYFHGGYVGENLADSEEGIDIGARNSWSGLYFRVPSSVYPYYYYIYQYYSPSAGNNGIGSTHRIDLKSSGFEEHETTTY